MMVSGDVYCKTPSDSLSTRDPLSAVLKISANSFGEISGSERNTSKEQRVFFAGAMGKARLFFILPF